MEYSTFMLILWVVSAGGLMYIIWRYIWYLNLDSDTQGIFSPSEQKDFRRNSFLNVLFLGFALIPLVIGIISIIDMEYSMGSLYVIYFGIYIINYRWEQKFPYIRITHDKIIFFKTLVYSPKVINKNLIQKVTVQTWTDFPYKIYILLPNDKKIDIHFYSIHKDDRKNLLQSLIQLNP